MERTYVEGLVSVIMPIYNAEKYLAATLNSIFEQDYGNIEIILVDDCSKDTHAKRLEAILYEKINALNIGAMGLKGKTTCLAVKVETFPCHIASLPVAVSLMCHANRHATCEL